MDGLYSLGGVEGEGKIDPRLLLTAYASGIFPMGLEDGSLGWFAPDPRGILPLEGLRISKSLRRVIRSGRFTISSNQDFEAVVQGCADRESTWIDDRIRESYLELHRLGCAHSVEAWDSEGLAGGLYGVALGGAFFGESMFSRRTDASKVCLAYLVQRLRAGGFQLLDVQWSTPHLQRLGVIEVPRREYERMLADALEVEGRWEDGEWEAPCPEAHFA